MTVCCPVWIGIQSKQIRPNHVEIDEIYEGWNFNSGNYLFTTDTKWIHVSKFYSPSM